jgi:hypothetical protein
LCEPRESASYLGLAHTGGSDHQDVLRGDFFSDLWREFLPA